MIKYQKNTLWLKPFVDSAKELILHNKIDEIKGYSVSLKRNHSQYGSLHKFANGHFSVNLKLFSSNKDRKRQVPDTMEIILCTLAHELAHTKHWTHTPEHFKLMCLILLRFSVIIKRLNIKNTSSGWK